MGNARGKVFEERCRRLTCFLLVIYIKVDIIVMEFEIIFYKDNEGNDPITDFLEKAAKGNRRLVAKTRSGIEKLRNRVYHQEPFSKHLESGLWELRIKCGTDIVRIIYTFHKGRVIILLHIFIKKQQKTPIGELELARKRLKEIKEREVN